MKQKNQHDPYNESATAEQSYEFIPDIQYRPGYETLQYGLDIADQIVYLQGDIMPGTLFSFIQKVRLLLKTRAEGDTSPITLVINSGGGDIHEMNGIIDYMNSLYESSNIQINVIARGVCYSAAANILISATGTRAAAKSTSIMFHKSSLMVPELSKFRDIKSHMNHLEILEGNMISILVAKSKMDFDYWNTQLNTDLFLTANEALDLGVIDQLI